MSAAAACPIFPLKDISSQELLLRFHVTGGDDHGLFSPILQTLQKFPQIPLVDLEHKVIRGILSLVLILYPQNHNTSELIEALHQCVSNQGLKLDYDLISKSELNIKGQYHRYVMTLLTESLSIEALAQLALKLKELKISVLELNRLADEYLGHLEVILSSPSYLDPHQIRLELFPIARAAQLDVAIQSEDWFRRPKRLLVMDMDSTLIQQEVIDELAREKGCYDQVTAITHLAMKGGMDFKESLKQRVKLLSGLHVESLYKVLDRVSLTEGAASLISVIQKLGLKTAVISGGFSFFTDAIKKQLHMDYAFSNQLIIENRQLTGELSGEIIDAAGKAEKVKLIAQMEKIDLQQVVAIGDGANDIPMLEAVGLGIAFNAKQSVEYKADVAITQKSLRSILYLLGLHQRDIQHLLD